MKDFLDAILKNSIMSKPKSISRSLTDCNCKSCREKKDFEFENLDYVPKIMYTPKPSTFYSIQHKKGGLLTTAGRAYRVKPGNKRLEYAKLINNHPLNRKFWIKPYNSFTKKHFPNGIISFKPKFTCEGHQKIAQSSTKSCFGRIWIPKSYTPYRCSIHDETTLSSNKACIIPESSNNRLKLDSAAIQLAAKKYPNKSVENILFWFCAEYGLPINGFTAIINRKRHLIGPLRREREVKNGKKTGRWIPYYMPVRIIEKLRNPKIAKQLTSQLMQLELTYFKHFNQNIDPALILLIAMRESESNIFRSKGYVNSFGNGGLDVFPNNYKKYKKRGFLPKNFPNLKKGRRVINEKNKKIDTVFIPSRHLLEAYGGAILRAQEIFELKLAQNLKEREVPLISNEVKRFWTTAFFGLPGKASSLLANHLIQEKDINTLPSIPKNDHILVWESEQRIAKGYNAVVQCKVLDHFLFG